MNQKTYQTETGDVVMLEMHESDKDLLVAALRWIGYQEQTNDVDLFRGGLDLIPNHYMDLMYSLMNALVEAIARREGVNLFEFDMWSCDEWTADHLLVNRTVL